MFDNSGILTLQMGKSGDYISENTYCQWDLNLDPFQTYFIYIQRDQQPQEVIEFQIYGQNKDEYIQDYKLQYDDKTAIEGWNKYLLQSPTKLSIYTRALDDSLGPTFFIKITLNNMPPQHMSVLSVILIIISIILFCCVIIACCGLGFKFRDKIVKYCCP